MSSLASDPYGYSAALQTALSSAREGVGMACTNESVTLTAHCPCPKIPTGGGVRTAIRVLRMQRLQPKQ